MKFVAAPGCGGTGSGTGRASYAKELVRVLRSTMARIESPEHSTLARRPEERILVLVLFGRARAGGRVQYKHFEKAAEFYRSKPGKQFTVIPIGKKGRDLMRGPGFTLPAIRERALESGLRNSPRHFRSW